MCQVQKLQHGFVVKLLQRFVDKEGTTSSWVIAFKAPKNNS